MWLKVVKITFGTTGDNPSSKKRVVNTVMWFIDGATAAYSIMHPLSPTYYLPTFVVLILPIICLCVRQQPLSLDVFAFPLRVYVFMSGVLHCFSVCSSDNKFGLMYANNVKSGRERELSSTHMVIVAQWCTVLIYSLWQPRLILDRMQTAFFFFWFPLLYRKSVTLNLGVIL